MKHIKYFKEFLAETVNLNDTRVASLEASVTAIKNAVNRCDWEPKILEYQAQGSWAHKTIIKPAGTKPFDADMLVIIEAVDGWEAKDYVNSLAIELGNLPTYKGMISRSSHCATVVYKGDKRIDIVPCIKGRLYPDKYEVCNRNANEFEDSEPTAYTKWVKERNAVVGSNDLVKTTRLLKYMRDIKQTFSCPSFLFTTLLGQQVLDSDNGSEEVKDLPTTLKTMVSRLDVWLQSLPYVPSVWNPALYSENQANCWTQDKYETFRDKIHQYREWIEDAYYEEDEDESIGKWRRVFGSDFAASHVEEAAVAAVRVQRKSAMEILGSCPQSVNENRPLGMTFYDLAHEVRYRGLAAIPRRLLRLPHIERPKWRKVPIPEMIDLRVSAQLKHGHERDGYKPVTSGEPLPPNRWIQFTALDVRRLVYSAEYEVQWQVVNTDKEAFDRRCLRGDFYPSETSNSRTEQLQYRGVHFVKAFLIRKRDKRQVGVSEPFYVVVDTYLTTDF